MKKMKYIKEHIITAAARNVTAAHTAAAALRTTAALRATTLLAALLICAGSLTAQQPAEQPASVELPPLEGKPATKRLSGHLIGVKYGFANCNLSFDKKINQKGITSGKEIGIFYTYYHSLWNTMPYFG
ncbi:MAG: hypothetical protein SOW22_00485, partial [Candidatus Egerieousia sp.]|nr:hypothetical protein [Candidatus Egerieousia sp.]